MTTVFVAQAVLVEPVEQPADVVVDRLDAGEVVLHVALVFPGVEGLAGERLLLAVHLDLDFGRLDAEPLVALGAVRSAGGSSFRSRRVRSSKTFCRHSRMASVRVA